jgi:hypothetical protein
MAYSALATKTSGNTNASADINQLDNNIEWIAWKQYVDGTAYTNGTPASSSTLAAWVPRRGTYIPYKTTDGAYRLYGSISADYTAGASQTITISGVTFKNTSGFNTPALCMDGSTIVAGYVVDNTGTIDVAVATAGTIHMTFDFELNAWPTWAD